MKDDIALLRNEPVLYAVSLTDIVNFKSAFAKPGKQCDIGGNMPCGAAAGENDFFAHKYLRGFFDYMPKCAVFEQHMGDYRPIC